MRVLYIAKHNTTDEYLVACCPFNYVEDECRSSDVTDNVRMIPISVWRKLQLELIEDKIMEVKVGEIYKHHKGSL